MEDVWTTSTVTEAPPASVPLRAASVSPISEAAVSVEASTAPTSMATLAVVVKLKGI